MGTVDTLLSKLDRVRQAGAGRWLARCPSHDDRTPSLGIRETDDGRVLIHCWGGCATSDVLASVGLTFADLFPEQLNRHPKPTTPPPRFMAADLIDLAALEARIVAVAASDLRNGRQLSPNDEARFDLAVRTLEAIAGEARR